MFSGGAFLCLLAIDMMVNLRYELTRFICGKFGNKSFASDSILRAMCLYRTDLRFAPVCEINFGNNKYIYCKQCTSCMEYHRGNYKTAGSELIEFSGH